MRDELTQLDVGDLALADFAREIDVLKDVAKAGVLGLDAGERLVEKVACIGVGVVHEMPAARCGRNPEEAVPPVPPLIFGRLLGFGFAPARLRF